jgi:uncharacterized membrane protein YtjA (UPF0391 family)
MRNQLVARVLVFFVVIMVVISLVLGTALSGSFR